MLDHVKNSIKTNMYDTESKKLSCGRKSLSKPGKIASKCEKRGNKYVPRKF